MLVASIGLELHHQGAELEGLDARRPDEGFRRSRKRDVRSFSYGKTS